MKEADEGGKAIGFDEGEITLAERLLSHVPILIAYVDTELKFQYVNVAYSDWYERRRDEVMGRSIRWLVGEETYAEIEPYLKKAMGGEKSEYERTFKQSDGKWISVFANYTPEFDDRGFVKGLVVTLQNITKRKSAQRDALRRIRHFQLVISATSDGFIQVGADGRILDVNRAYVERSGYRRDELLSMPLSELEGVESDVNIHEHIRLIRERGQDRFETVHVTKSGERWPVEVNTVYLNEDGGMFFSFLHDVSERRERERLLQESELKYRTLTESAPVGVVMQAASGQIVSFNPMALEILDMTEDQLFGRTSEDPIWQAIHEDGTAFPGESHPAMISLRTGDSVRNTVMGLQYLRETRWISINSEPVFSADSNIPQAVISTFIDVTESKQNAVHLDLAKKEAERASKAKSEFLASMSHELRTPLNAILGYAQMLKLNQEQNLSEHQMEYLEYIFSGGEHLLSLVNDVLDLMHIEADRLSVFLEDVNAGEMVAECVNYLRPAAESRNVSFVDKIGGQCPTSIFSDRLRYRQILINLISNAIKFNRDGGSVTLECQVVEERYCRISVSDTGIGIDDLRARDLFRLFHRSDDDSRVATDGNGIGLAVSKMLVERLGGRIGFSSEIGEGSIFWVDMPLKTNDQIIIWTDEYRVGVDAIDKDHQAIFKLTNRASQQDLTSDQMARIVEELVDYTHYHFRREEVIMEVCGYPDLVQHRRRHRKLEAYVAELSREWREKNDGDALIRLRGFLRNWWSSHIMQVDKTIGPYAKGREMEIRDALHDMLDPPD